MKMSLLPPQKWTDVTNVGWGNVAMQPALHARNMGERRVGGKGEEKGEEGEAEGEAEGAGEVNGWDAIFVLICGCFRSLWKQQTRDLGL